MSRQGARSSQSLVKLVTAEPPSRRGRHWAVSSRHSSRGGTVGHAVGRACQLETDFKRILYMKYII